MYTLFQTLYSFASIDNSYHISIVWGAILLFAIIIEAVTFSIVSIWFIPGAVVALILSFIPGIPLWTEILVFTVLTVLTFIFLNKRLAKRKSEKKPLANADVVIGQTGIITEDVNNIIGKGAVKVLGKEWTARSEFDNDSLVEGDYVTILSIQGVKLICKKK